MGDAGTVLKWDGKAWTAQSLMTNANLAAIWGTDAKNIWVVGSGGMTWKWDGTAWTTISTGTLQALFGVWGTDANNVWAVGNGGTIIKMERHGLDNADLGTASYLRGIWGTDSNNIWAVGGSGTILKWNGTTWTAQAGPPETLLSVWGTSPATSGSWGTGKVSALERHVLDREWPNHLDRLLRSPGHRCQQCLGRWTK